MKICFEVGGKGKAPFWTFLPLGARTLLNKLSSSFKRSSILAIKDLETMVYCILQIQVYCRPSAGNENTLDLPSPLKKVLVFDDKINQSIAIKKSFRIHKEYVLFSSLQQYMYIWIGQSRDARNTKLIETWRYKNQWTMWPPQSPLSNGGERWEKSTIILKMIKAVTFEPGL